MKVKGGDWEEGMAIYDTIKACPNPVIILNYTWARSMSSLIMCAATKRVMMPNSKFMIHDGALGLSGSVRKVRTGMKQEEKSMNIMMNIYSDILYREGKCQYKTKPKIRSFLKKEMMKKEDVFYTAQEAVDIGFADEVFGNKGVYDWKKLLETTDEQRSR
jgi:ATP-dependent protease ClpP protease subunit